MYDRVGKLAHETLLGEERLKWDRVHNCCALMAINTTILGPSRPCGGSRAGAGCVIERVVNPGERLTIDVRGSAYGEAFLTGADRIEATWFTSKLVGTIPDIGRVVFTTRADAQSRVTIVPDDAAGFRAFARRAIFRSNRLVQNTKLGRTMSTGLAGSIMASITDSVFLPAVASQEMFFDVQIVNAEGVEMRRLRGSSAMDFTAAIAAIPPLGTTFRTRTDVEFRDMADGTLVFSMLAGAPGLVNDAPGLDISVASPAVDFDRLEFQATGVVTVAASPLPSRVCWFVTGVMGARLTSPAQGIDVLFDGRLEIPVAASFDESDRRAAVIIQCFSSDEPAMEKHFVVVFRDL